MKSWLIAFRLRTLPLAFACIATGSFIAAAEGRFKWQILALALVTTLFLQILSNLANDYGDSVHGADSDERTGPARSVQSGEISPAAMKRAIVLFAVLAFITGVALIYYGLYELPPWYLAGFFILGLCAIAASIKYTAGKNPYGYKGLGDLFVFIFFGIVGVFGTYFLHTHLVNLQVFLPAASIGLLATGVLNVNNMRDTRSDLAAGKTTIPIRLGPTYAKAYHTLLIVVAIITMLIYTALNYSKSFQLLFCLSVPLFFVHLIKVYRNKEPEKLDKQLKVLVLSTLLFSLLFGVGLLI